MLTSPCTSLCPECFRSLTSSVMFSLSKIQAISSVLIRDLIAMSSPTRLDELLHPSEEINSVGFQIQEIANAKYWFSSQLFEDSDGYGISVCLVKSSIRRGQCQVMKSNDNLISGIVFHSHVLLMGCFDRALHPQIIQSVQ